MFQPRTYLSTLLLLFIILLANPGATGQQANIEGNLYPAYSGHIEGEDGIAGYYFLTQMSKEKMVRKGNKRKPKTVYFSRLTLMDQSLNVIGTKDLRTGGGVFVTDVAYNGTYLAVKMIDHENEKKWVEVLDAQGETIRRAGLKYGPYDDPKISSQMGTFMELGLAPVPGGFVDLTIQASGKKVMSRSMYEAKFISNDPEDRGFFIRSARNSKDYEAAEYLGAGDSLIVLGIMKRPNMLSQKPKTDVVAYHVRTGKKVWTLPADEDGTAVRWFSARFMGDELVLGGMDVGRNGKLYTDIPEGLQLRRVSLEGKMLAEKRIDLKEMLSNEMDGASGKTLNNLGNIYLHDIELTDGGDVLVATEFYKTFNGGATAQEGLLLHLDPSFNLVGTNVLDKGKSGNKRGLVLTLTGGINLAKKGSVAALAKAQGAFDFALMRSNGPSITSIYFAGNSEVRKTKQLALYVTSLLDGELSSEKISLPAETDFVKVLPADEGYVMLVEYDSEGGAINIHRERLRL